MRQSLNVQRGKLLPITKLKADVVGAMLAIEQRLGSLTAKRPVPPRPRGGDNTDALIGNLIVDLVLGPAIQALAAGSLFSGLVQALETVLPRLDYGAGFEALTEVYDGETHIPDAVLHEIPPEELALYAHELRVYEAELTARERLLAMLSRYERELETLESLEEEGVTHAELSGSEEDSVRTSYIPEFARHAAVREALYQPARPRLRLACLT